MALAVVCLSFSCVTYEISGVEVDGPLETEQFEFLVEGKTTIGASVYMMGPPDLLAFRWDEDGDRHTRMDYYFNKGRSSDLRFMAPFEFIEKFNSLVVFYNLFQDTLEGSAPYEDKLKEVGFIQADANKGYSYDTGHRLSEKRGSLSGRAVRKSDIIAYQESDPDVKTRPLSVFVPLELMSKGTGADKMRLEFNHLGILELKEIRLAAPDTGVVSQIRETVLQ